MAVKISKESRREIAAIAVFVVWLIAFVIQVKTKGQIKIPWELTAAMLGAVGLLLGVNLPMDVGFKRKDGDGPPAAE